MFSSKKQKHPTEPPGISSSSGSAVGHITRFQDLKRDGPSRIKHFKIVLDSMTDPEERRQFLSQYSFETFHLFHDLLCQADMSPPTVSRPGGEIEFALWALEQILCYLPELVSRRWQYHAIGNALKKCLNPENVIALRKIAIRLFIMWYETLSLGPSGAPEHLDRIFSLLVPYLPLPGGKSSDKLLLELCEGPGFSHKMPSYVPDGAPYLHKNLPLVTQPHSSAPMSPGQVSGLLQVYMDKVFDSVVKETTKIEWHISVRSKNHRKALEFLFDKIEAHYISVCFPSHKRSFMSFYGSGFDLPTDPSSLMLSPLSPTDPMVLCKYCVIRWISAYSFSHKNLNDSMNQSQSLETKYSLGPEVSSKNSTPNSKMAKLPPMYDQLRSVLFGSPRHIDFTLNILKEGLLLPMECYGVIGRIFRTLKEWIFMDEIPIFMREPASGNIPGKDCVEAGAQTTLQAAINILCWFYFSPYLLEEKRNIAFQVNHKILGLLKDLASPQREPDVQLSSETWLVLLKCLLRIVEHTLPRTPPSSREAYHFAKGVVTSLFQTLLITWVLASAVCRVSIPADLWSELVRILSERTAWPELIDEWNKVLESVTRALSLNFYEIDLQNPPLERLSEQKLKKQMGASRGLLPPNQATTGDASPAKEPYDFCKTASPSSSLTASSFKSEEKAESETESSTSKNHPVSDGSESPMLNMLNQSKQSTDSITQDDSHTHSDSGSAPVTNPEVVSLGSVSIDSNSIGLLASEKDPHDGGKVGAIFGDRDSMTPSPVHNGAPEGLMGDFEAVDDGEVELTPRNDGEKSSDGTENIWMIVWRRILGCIGDVNDMRDPSIHANALRVIKGVVEMLGKIKANQGVSLDGQATQWSTYTPPLQCVSPWLTGCFLLPENFEKSKVTALETLSQIVFTRQNTQVNEELSLQFYESVHKAAQSNTEEFSRVIVRCVCPKILHQCVSGWQVLIGECLMSSERVMEARKDQITSPETGQALNFIAQLACFPGKCDSSWSVFGQKSSIEELKIGEMMTDCVGFLVKAVRDSRLERNVVSAAINSLCVLVCNKRGSSQLCQEVLSCLLQLLMDKSDFSLQICDNLSALLDTRSYSCAEYKEVIVPVIRCYCAMLERSYSLETYTELCQRLLTDLTDWCLGAMKILLEESSGSDNQNLMHSILRVVNLCLQDEGLLFPCASACQKLLTQFWLQFPLPKFSVAHLSSEETEYGEDSGFLSGDQRVVTCSEDMIWSAKKDGEGCNGLGCQILTRNVTAKHCWLVTEKECGGSSLQDPFTSVNAWLAKSEKLLASKKDNLSKRSSSESVLSGRSLIRESENEGFLGDLCLKIAVASPEAVPHLNFPNPSDEPEIKKESDVLAALHQLSLTFGDGHMNSSTKEALDRKKGAKDEAAESLDRWRSLLGDLSLITWNKNAMFTVLKKDSGRLQRELKHLDKIICRETHKLAVLFVAEGQEDKHSILNNSSGSHLFEEFVGRLGWDIDLSTHSGYSGGLPSEGSTPYYATLSMEIIYHVSTRLPSSDQTKKLRHLGNDEVHIVWSEHWRDYRRSIIATEFCDVLIVIYPLPNKLFRLQVETRLENKDFCSFGPLFDGVIVSWAGLAPLVRATAVNASRSKRRRVSGWKHWYDQRADAVATVKKQLGKTLPFSGLTTRLYSEKESDHKSTKASAIAESSDVVMV